MDKSAPKTIYQYIIMMNKTIASSFKLFLALIATLIIIGFVFIYSSSSVFALELHGSSFYFLKKQLVGCIIGLCALALIQLIPATLIKKSSPFIFITSIIMTSLTLIPSLTQKVYGSSRWLKLGPLSFQPSEFLKIGIILFLAYYITKQPQKKSFWYGFIPILSILIIPSLILLKQPDFGMTVTLCLTTLIILFIAEFELRHVFFTILALIPVAVGLIISQPYRLQRIATFLNPWSDPQGAGFQIIQSLIAIGSGGFWGTGIAHSKQKFFYLPMQHTDFIFSIIAEETGFMGALILISLYITLLYLGIKIARHCHDLFTRFTVLGFVVMLNLQTIINIGVATDILPTKGIGLPLISYGNSALICLLIMLGIIINLIRSEKFIY